MSETRERSRWSFLQWIGLALVAYLVVFAALLVDTFVFQNVLYEALGPEIQSFIEVIYWPLIEAVKDLGWVDD